MRKIRIYQILFLFIFVSGQFQIALAQPGSDIVLARGNPPLTQSMVFKSIDLLEWSLDIRFPSEQKSKIQQILVNAWASNNQAQIQSTLEVVDIQTKLSQMAPSERNNFKDRFKLIILENLRKDPNDELSQTVLTVVQSTNEITKTPETKTENNRITPENKPRNDVVKQNQADPIARTDSEELWTFSLSAPLTIEQAKAILQKGVPVNTVVTDSKFLTFEQAISNARKFLNERASTQALAAFNASPQARDAKRAAVAAGGAMIANKPLAALATLLRAHELEPQNITYLVNLAAVLSLMEMPREALAILDSAMMRNGRIASPLGMGGKAGALTIRGFALLKLGKL